MSCFAGLGEGEKGEARGERNGCNCLSDGSWSDLWDCHSTFIPGIVCHPSRRQQNGIQSGPSVSLFVQTHKKRRAIGLQ